MPANLENSAVATGLEKEEISQLQLQCPSHMVVPLPILPTLPPPPNNHVHCGFSLSRILVNFENVLKRNI